jgi:hypothetical protein
MKPGLFGWEKRSRRGDLHPRPAVYEYYGPENVDFKRLQAFLPVHQMMLVERRNATRRRPG